MKATAWQRYWPIDGWRCCPVILPEMNNRKIIGTVGALQYEGSISFRTRIWS
jgi:hypothetical protein